MTPAKSKHELRGAAMMPNEASRSLRMPQQKLPQKLLRQGT